MKIAIQSWMGNQPENLVEAGFLDKGSDRKVIMSECGEVFHVLPIIEEIYELGYNVMLYHVEDGMIICIDTKRFQQR